MLQMGRVVDGFGGGGGSYFNPCIFVALSGAAMGMVVGVASGFGRAYLFSSGKRVAWNAVQAQSLGAGAFLSCVFGVGGGMKCVGGRR